MLSSTPVVPAEAGTQGGGVARPSKAGIHPEPNSTVVPAEAGTHPPDPVREHPPKASAHPELIPLTHPSFPRRREPIPVTLSLAPN